MIHVRVERIGGTSRLVFWISPTVLSGAKRKNINAFLLFFFTVDIVVVGFFGCFLPFFFFLKCCWLSFWSLDTQRRMVKLVANFVIQHKTKCYFDGGALQGSGVARAHVVQMTLRHGGVSRRRWRS